MSNKDFGNGKATLDNGYGKSKYATINIHSK